MDDLAQKIELAAGHVQVRWSPDRERAVHGSMVRRRAQRKLIRASVVGVGLAAAAVLVVAFQSGGPASAVAVRDAQRLPTLDAIVMGDGSEVRPIRQQTTVEPIVVDASRVEMELQSGAATFQVTRNEGRQFVVRAGNVRVTVLGTQFVVDRRTDGVVVRVISGHVKVTWPGGGQDLRDGQQRMVENRLSDSPANGEVESEFAKEPSAAKVPEIRPVVVPAVPAVSSQGVSWRALAAGGEHKKAYSLIEGEPGLVDGTPGDLMLAADVARLAGRSDRSVEYLKRVADQHPADSRAPLAAFTVGRIFLDQLGRPAQAAEAFAQAQRLAPSGALAQDALAREVEARSKAGQADLARARAQQYVAQFPGGSRMQSVRKFGGLD